MQSDHDSSCSGMEVVSCNHRKSRNQVKIIKPTENFRENADIFATGLVSIVGELRGKNPEFRLQPYYRLCLIPSGLGLFSSNL